MLKSGGGTVVRVRDLRIMGSRRGDLVHVDSSLIGEVANSAGLLKAHEAIHMSEKSPCRTLIGPFRATDPALSPSV